MSRKWCLLLLVILLAVAAPVAAQETRPVIVDTDMVTDDWMAILLILNDPAFSVKAITVTGTGFAYCDAGVEVALGLLALTGYGDVPVSCWTEKPLMGDNAPPAEWRTSMETVEALGLPAGGEPAEQNAVELFTATVENSPEPITVLALGPLTNVGAALGPSRRW
ncbi:MAG: nucleoside hydrolase [Chloroflexi bacterium]|nr:nucleoside hydrolase [Chloroflexota bacterium]